MVGFSVEGAAAAGEEKEGHEPSLDYKKQLTQNDQLDICFPELEDFSLSFSDSFLDFDSIDGWFVEGKNDFCGGLNMADLGELGAFKEGFDVSVCGLEKEKGESGGVELDCREECEKANGDMVFGGDGGSGTKSEHLGCLIEEKLGKVSLEGTNDCLIPSVASENDKSVGGDVVGANGNELTRFEKAGDNDDARCSDVESESEVSLSLASSDTASGSSDKEEEDKKTRGTRGKKKRQDEIGIEEGEIVLSDVDEIAGWSDYEDDGSGSGTIGPVSSKNELKVLPPVPSVTITLEPYHQTLPVGTILSIVGAQVIIEGVEKHNPLNEGSVLWITESRLPLGIVDEIFGPVKNPYYIVRYNSETELPAGIQQGTSISFVPEFVDHILNDKSLYQKGYDASGENDEELSVEMEFSDDEKEAEYRRMLKMKKRGTNESMPGNKRKDKRKVKNKNRDPAAHGNNPPVTEDQHFAPSVVTSSNIRPNMPGNQPMVPPIWYGAQPPGFPTSSGIWTNGFQPQHTGLPNRPWMHQNRPNQLFQAPFPTNIPFQQQISTLPIFPLNFNALAGQANFCGGPGPVIGPWPTCLDPNMLNTMQFGIGLQAQQGSLPPSGAGEQIMQSPGSHTDSSAQTSPAIKPQNFNQGRGGGGRRGHHRGRGRFGGGRGRYQSH